MGNETNLQKQEPCRCCCTVVLQQSWTMFSSGGTLHIRGIFIIELWIQMRLFPLLKEGLLSLQKKTSGEAVEHLKLMRTSGLAELHVWGAAPRQDQELWGSRNPGSLRPVCFMAREVVSLSVTHNYPLPPTPSPPFPTMEKEMETRSITDSTWPDICGPKTRTDQRVIMRKCHDGWNRNALQ